MSAHSTPEGTKPDGAANNHLVDPDARGVRLTTSFDAESQAQQLIEKFKETVPKRVKDVLPPDNHDYGGSVGLKDQVQCLKPILTKIIQAQEMRASGLNAAADEHLEEGVKEFVRYMRFLKVFVLKGKAVAEAFRGEQLFEDPALAEQVKKAEKAALKEAAKAKAPAQRSERPKQQQKRQRQLYAPPAYGYGYYGAPAVPPPGYMYGHPSAGAGPSRAGGDKCHKCGKMGHWAKDGKSSYMPQPK